MRPQNKSLKGFTKKQLLTAALLILDENVQHIECELIKKEGNLYCDTYLKTGTWSNCTNCMLNQYLAKAKAGQVSAYEVMLKKQEGK